MSFPCWRCSKNTTKKHLEKRAFMPFLVKWSRPAILLGGGHNVSLTESTTTKSITVRLGSMPKARRKDRHPRSSGLRLECRRFPLLAPKTSDAGCGHYGFKGGHYGVE